MLCYFICNWLYVCMYIHIICMVCIQTHMCTYTHVRMIFTVCVYVYTHNMYTHIIRMVCIQTLMCTYTHIPHELCTYTHILYVLCVYIHTSFEIPRRCAPTIAVSSDPVYAYCTLQAGEHAQDASQCRSLFAKKPFKIGIFAGNDLQR